MIKRSFIGLSEPKLFYDLITSDPKEPEAIPMPPRLILQVNEPLNSAKKLLIKKGDAVTSGQRLCLYQGSKAYAVSPASGTVLSIASHTGDFGTVSTQITLQTGQAGGSANEFADHTDVPDLESAAKFLSGVPGSPALGTLDPDKINTIIITGIDQDLLSTTQQYFLATSMEDVRKGTQILKQITGVSNISIAVPEGMNSVSMFEGVQILRVSPEYPNGLPAMILKQNLNIDLPQGLTPEDIGICFINVEAVAAIARSYKTKSPAIDKVVTVVNKQGAMTPVKAMIGTPIHIIFSELGLSVNDADRIIMGGPMRGFATYTLDQPVLSTTDTIMIQDKEDIPYVSDYPCINCGRCVKICPTNVPVNLLVRFLEANLYDEAVDNYDLNSCIDCGLCSYVCMARIPIFQYIKLGKFELSKAETQSETEGANA